MLGRWYDIMDGIAAVTAFFNATVPCHSPPQAEAWREKEAAVARKHVLLRGHLVYELRRYSRSIVVFRGQRDSPFF